MTDQTIDELLTTLDAYNLNKNGTFGEFTIAEIYAMYPELKTAKQAIKELIDQARIDELKRTIKLDNFENILTGFGRGEIENRLTYLMKESK